MSPFAPPLPPSPESGAESGPKAGIDWAQTMGLATRMFGLGPAEFWALPIADWRALTAAAAAAAHAEPPEPQALAALMARFPDRPPQARSVNPNPKEQS